MPASFAVVHFSGFSQAVLDAVVLSRVHMCQMNITSKDAKAFQEKIFEVLHPI